MRRLWAPIFARDNAKKRGPSKTAVFAFRQTKPGGPDKPNEFVMRIFCSCTLVAILLLLATGCGETAHTPPQSAKQATPTADSTLLAEWEAWKAERLQSLVAPNGWLTLVGLHWLQPGAHTIGSDSANQIVLPPPAPAFMGKIVWDERGLWGQFEADAGVQLDDSTVTHLPLRTDREGAPTVLHTGSLFFYLIERAEAIGLRVRDTLAPARLQFEGIDYFPYDPAWRLTAHYKPYEPPKPFVFDNVLHMPIRQDIPGRVIFQVGGRSFALDVLEGGPDELFLLFVDQTTGTTTYGGGRYLYAPRPDSTGTLILDFNKAYNPPCAYTEFATCLLPPPQNILHVAIEAGERYHGTH